MKKKIISLVLCLFIILLVGCSKDDEKIINKNINEARIESVEKAILKTNSIMPLYDYVNNYFVYNKLLTSAYEINFDHYSYNDSVLNSNVDSDFIYKLPVYEKSSSSYNNMLGYLKTPFYDNVKIMENGVLVGYELKPILASEFPIAIGDNQESAKEWLIKIKDDVYFNNNQGENIGKIEIEDIVYSYKHFNKILQKSYVDYSMNRNTFFEKYGNLFDWNSYINSNFTTFDIDNNDEGIIVRFSEEKKLDYILNLLRNSIFPIASKEFIENLGNKMLNDITDPSTWCTYGDYYLSSYDEEEKTFIIKTNKYKVSNISFRVFNKENKIDLFNQGLIDYITVSDLEKITRENNAYASSNTYNTYLYINSYTTEQLAKYTSKDYNVVKILSVDEFREAINYLLDSQEIEALNNRIKKTGLIGNNNYYIEEDKIIYYNSTDIEYKENISKAIKLYEKALNKLIKEGEITKNEVINIKFAYDKNGKDSEQPIKGNVERIVAEALIDKFNIELNKQTKYPNIKINFIKEEYDSLGDLNIDTTMYGTFDIIIQTIRIGSGNVYTIINNEFPAFESMNRKEHSPSNYSYGIFIDKNKLGKFVVDDKEYNYIEYLELISK